MKLDRHIDSAAQLYRDTYYKLNALHSEKAEAKAKLAQEKKKLTSTAQLAAEDAFRKEFREKRIAIEEELEAGLAAIEAEMNNDLKEIYKADGKAIDPADQALLATGILTESEIADMVAKHGENPTMLRIIGNHLGEKLSTYPDSVKLAISVAKDAGMNEQRVFRNFKYCADSPVKLAREGCAGTDTWAEICLKVDSYADVAKRQLNQVREVSSGNISSIF